jgi:deoxyribose-phosphate aldolase
MTENATLTRAVLARMIDHTLLAPEATTEDVARLAREAGRLGVGAICVSPSRLPLIPGLLAPGIAVAAVTGFPSGAHSPAVKAAEAAAAVAAGAGEIDMVIDPTVVLKAIIESAAIGPARIAAACHAAEAGGASFVKTSTGFHKAGGATVEAVAAMAAAVHGRLGVKASGGIRSAADALAMIGAGATRIGASASAAILDGLPG